MLAAYIKPTLIEVVTPHCVECRAMQPDLDAVAGEFDSVDLIVLDATRHKETVAELRVLGTPTLIAVRDGAEIARFTGRRTRGELDELFAAVATGDPTGLANMTRSDRVVWSVAGAALAGAGLTMGPAWLLVAIGGAMLGYAIIRGSRSKRRQWSKSKS